MKYEIIEKDNVVTVKASVRTRKFARDPVSAINTKDILEILTKNGYNVEKYKVIKEGNCTNYKSESRTSDEWILELKERKEDKVVKPAVANRKRQSRRRNSSGKENKLLGNENVGRVRTQTQTSVSGQNQEISGK